MAMTKRDFSSALKSFLNESPVTEVDSKNLVESVRSMTETEADAQRVLGALFLNSPGNRETVKLLMRGMPVPACYGFPGTDGSLLSNVRAFVENFHPLISCWRAHVLHPFSRKERTVVFLCTVGFNFLFTQFTERSLSEYFTPLEQRRNHSLKASFIAVKYVSTILYAVLIRQLVICPCIYAPLLLDRCALQDAATAQEATQILVDQAGKVFQYKAMGDQLLLVLFAIHLGVIFWIIFWYYAFNDIYNTLWQQVFFSEALNFSLWFVKFAPLFLALYPIDKARWFKGGKLKDYLTCSRSLRYKQSRTYLDRAFPRSVHPETTRVRGQDDFVCTALCQTAHLSTFDNFEPVKARTRASFFPKPVMRTHSDCKKSQLNVTVDANDDGADGHSGEPPSALTPRRPPGEDDEPTTNDGDETKSDDRAPPPCVAVVVDQPPLLPPPDDEVITTIYDDDDDDEYFDAADEDAVLSPEPELGPEPPYDGATVVPDLDELVDEEAPMPPGN